MESIFTHAHAYRTYVPVIEDLTTHDVSPYAPAVLPSFLPQPVVSQNLNIKIMDLETAVVNMPLWPLEDKKDVVIH